MKNIFIQRMRGLLCATLLGLLPYTSNNLNAQNQTDIAPKITFDKSLLTPEGNLTEQSLPKFLAEAYKEKKLKDDAFSKEACLKAKNLGTEGGGYNTKQLFEVMSTCHPKEASMYIIKEAKHGLDEATNLKKIEAFPGMKELIAPKKVKGLPSLALPFAYFTYSNGGLHYIAAMPAAKGVPLSALIIKFGKDQSPQNREKLSRAFKILGKEISAFHKRFMKPEKGKILGNTIVHGDFHPLNLFFDEIGGHFTFIDNETMANSLQNPTSPSVDLVKLFFMPFSLNQDYQQFHDLIKGIDLKTWWDIALKNFIMGYLESYKPTESKQVLQELKKMFNDPFEIKWVDFDQQQLNNMRTQYINPVFDEIQKRLK